MTAEDNRMAQLRALVDAMGVASGEVDPKRRRRAGFREVAARAGINEEYVYQLYTGKKSHIGTEKARAIAEAFANGRALEWFDEPLDDPSRVAPGFHQVTASQMALLEDFELLPDDEKQAIQSTLRSKADNVRRIFAEYLKRKGLSIQPDAEQSPNKLK